ncbi:MAG: hypothetical protein R3F11_10750 [Verrucomicrobiales bacterium]
MVAHTLHRMADGAIRVPGRSGFHRYSADVRMGAAQFEKMLVDQAETLALVAARIGLTGEPRLPTSRGRRSIMPRRGSR